jgi:hypothetical protein
MKPFALPKALQSLTNDQLVEVHEWLDDPSSTYKIIRQKLADLHRIKISDATLSRYNERRVLAEETIDHADSAQNIRAFIAIQNAEPVAYDTAGLALIQKRAFNAACAPRITVPNLASLQRIFNYNAVRGDIEHRKQIAERKTAVAEGLLALQREKLTAAASFQNSKLNTKNSKLSSQGDELGPYATNWDEVGHRVCKQFGFSHEELLRRAQLRRTWKNPNDHLNAQPSTPVAADVRRLTSTSRADINETTAAKADQKPQPFPLPAEAQGQEEEFRAQSNEARPIDPTPSPSASNSAAPDFEFSIHNSQLPATPPLPYPPNTIPPREAAYFKALAAQAAALLNEFNARRTNHQPEKQPENPHQTITEK